MLKRVVRHGPPKTSGRLTTNGGRAGGGVVRHGPPKTAARLTTNGRGERSALGGEAVGVEGGVGDFDVEADALAEEGLEVAAVPGDGDVDAVGDFGIAVGV